MNQPRNKIFINRSFRKIRVIKHYDANQGSLFFSRIDQNWFSHLLKCLLKNLQEFQTNCAANMNEEFTLKLAVQK